MTITEKCMALSILVVVSISAYAEESTTEISADRGKMVYQNNCASCHQSENTKAPTLASLKQKPAEFIKASLTQGKMRAQGLPMGVHKIASVVKWLTKDQPEPVNWVSRFACSNTDVDLNAGPVLGDWGYGAKNHRYQTAERGGITSANVSDLTLKWAMAFPNATEMRSQPALIGDKIGRAHV